MVVVDSGSHASSGGQRGVGGGNPYAYPVDAVFQSAQGEDLRGMSPPEGAPVLLPPPVGVPAAVYVSGFEGVDGVLRRNVRSNQVTALVLSLAGFLFGFFTAIPGTVLGFVSYGKAKRLGLSTAVSVAAISFGVVIIAVNILLGVVLLMFLSSFAGSLERSSGDVFVTAEEGNVHYREYGSYKTFTPEVLSGSSSAVKVYVSLDGDWLCVQGTSGFGDLHMVSKEGVLLFAGDVGGYGGDGFDNGLNYARAGGCELTVEGDYDPVVGEVGGNFKPVT